MVHAASLQMAASRVLALRTAEGSGRPHRSSSAVDRESGAPRIGVERAALGFDLDLALRERRPEQIAPNVEQEQVDEFVTLQSARLDRISIRYEAVGEFMYVGRHAFDPPPR